MLELKNPHSVLAVLQRRPRDVSEISILGQPGGAWDDVVELARQNRIPVVAATPRSGNANRRDGKEERVGVAVALVKDPPETQLEKMFANAKQADGKSGGVWLALDCLQDPHNVGAIFRTAGFFGVKGIIQMRDRAAPITGTVCDVAAGGVESVPFCSVINLKRAFELAKESGLWLLGTSEHGKETLQSYSADRSWMVVLGNEERGIRQGTLENCDCICAIKPRGAVTSLNVSVAAGICISWLSS